MSGVEVGTMKFDELVGDEKRERKENWAEWDWM